MKLLRNHLLRRPGRLLGLSVIAGLLFIALFGPTIQPSDPNDQDIAHRLEGPSADHWLGTDHLGRDIASRLIVGTRVGLTLGIPVVAIALTIGLAIGLASGYRRGRIDTITLLVVDFLAAFRA